MGSGDVVFRASRWRLAFWIAVGLLIGGFCFSTSFISEVRAGRLQGEGLVLLLLPGNARAVFFEICGGILLVFSALQLQFFADDRMVFIDDEGIRVRGVFGARSGYWQDFRGLRRTAMKGTEHLSLAFAPSSNPASAATTSRLVALPARLYGVPQAPLLLAIKRRTSGLGSAARGETGRLPAGAPRAL